MARIADVVFTSTKGKILDPTSVTEAFKRLLGQAGLPLETRIHDLRHTAISQMLANGAQIKVVSEIAGHSSVKITMDIYGHSYDENKRAAVEAVGKVMKRKVN
jgi:integrase